MATKNNISKRIQNVSKKGFGWKKIINSDTEKRPLTKKEIINLYKKGSFTKRALTSIYKYNEFAKDWNRKNEKMNLPKSLSWLITILGWNSYKKWHKRKYTSYIFSKAVREFNTKNNWTYLYGLLVFLIFEKWREVFKKIKNILSVLTNFRKKLFSDNKDNSLAKFKQDESSEVSIKKQYIGRPILQFSTNWNFIKEWPSTISAGNRIMN